MAIGGSTFRKKKVTSTKVTKKKTSSKKPRKKRIRNNKSHSKTEVVHLQDGDVQLYRREASGKIWQFQMWIAEEGKYLRRTTKKRNLEDATHIAKDIYLDAITRMRSELPVFPVPALELVNQFLEQKQKEVGVNKTHGRYVTLRTQCRHFIDFVGSTTNMTDIKKSQFDDYYSFRRNEHPEVVDSTLVAERGTIRAIYKYAISRGIVPYIALPEFTPLKKVHRKRRLIDVEEYRKIYEYMRTKDWTHCDTEFDTNVRKYLRYFVQVLSNTGIRFGEARRLQWRDIKIIKTGKRHEWTVDIDLDASKTKTNRPRTVQGRRGSVFEDIKRLSEFTDSNDYVFVDSSNGQQLGRDYYYRNWKKMLRATGLDEHQEPVTFYHLRHFYAVQRLYANANAYALAKSMGCSMKYLEDHYGQVETEKMRKNLTQQVQYDEEGNIILSNEKVF